jgi:hypothetical protein
MLGNMFAAGVSPLIILFVEDLHMTVTRASQLSSWALLSLGISVFAVKTSFKLVDTDHRIESLVTAHSCVHRQTLHDSDFASIIHSVQYLGSHSKDFTVAARVQNCRRPWRRRRGNFRPRDHSAAISRTPAGTSYGSLHYLSRCRRWSWTSDCGIH